MAKLIATALAVLLAGCQAAATEQPARPYSVAYSQPDGPGPFPAVLLLHGCSGVGRNHALWARRLVDWGYAAALIDSFGPRGVKSVCGEGGRVVSPDERALDAFDAAQRLRENPEIDGARIGIVGFSHGGWTVLRAVLRSTVEAAAAPPFPAAVAYYPSCPRSAGRRATDTLILIGGSDDWTPAQRCVDYERRAGTPPSLDLVVYPGAHHGFDSNRPRRTVLGHTLAYDADAAEDSFRRARAFLDRRLKP